MTNFKIYLAESRPIWLLGGYLSARSLGVRKVQQGLECPGGRRNGLVGNGLGPGNTNLRVDGWVGSTLPPPTLARTAARTLQYRHPVDHPAAGTPGTCTYDRFGRRQGDPRGQ